MKNRAGIRSYLVLMIMTIVVYTAASCLFIFVFRDPSPVPVFVSFCVIQCIGFVLYALLPDRFKPIPRHASKIIVGMTLLVLAGFLGRQNFQIEGFVYLLFAGFFGGAILHFGMKVIGALINGRTWCSWGCWTAALLDFLPYNRGTKWKRGPFRYFRYLHLLLSIGVVVLAYFGLGHLMQSTSADPAQNWKESGAAVYWLAIGNGLYYMMGIILAFIMKDNRAFCKYICPVAVLLKVGGIFSLVRISARGSSCGGCRKCESVCPSSIAVHSYVKAGRRVTSTECMLCLNCVSACEEGNLKTSFGFDCAAKEILNRK
jgi:ferredoxin-type protein NapH